MTMRAGPVGPGSHSFHQSKTSVFTNKKKPIGTDRQAFRFFAKLLISERVLRMNHREYLP